MMFINQMKKENVELVKEVFMKVNEEDYEREELEEMFMSEVMNEKVANVVDGLLEIVEEKNLRNRLLELK